MDSEHSALKQQMKGVRQLQDEQQQAFVVKLQSLQKVVDQLEQQQTEHNRQRETINEEYKTVLADLVTQKPQNVWTNKRLLLGAIAATFIAGISILGGWSAKTAQIYQHYSPAELEYLSKLWQWNSDRLLKCQTTQNPKCTIWIVPPPSK